MVILYHKLKMSNVDVTEIVSSNLESMFVCYACFLLISFAVLISEGYFRVLVEKR